MFEVELGARPVGALQSVLDPEDYERLEASLASLSAAVDGRRLWHVNSTPQGGGVAELLSTLLPYSLDAAIDVHWLVVEGRDGYFDLTKRIHNMLHESPAAGPPGPDDPAEYAAGLTEERAEVTTAIRPGDVVILHDPQTAGLAPTLVRHGATVLWRCHVGTDSPGPSAREAWDLLLDDVRAAHRVIFTRPSYVWDGLDPSRVSIMVPCIDVLSPKNAPLSPSTVTSVLRRAGIGSDGDGAGEADVGGRPVPVTHAAQMIEDAPVPARAPLVLQVSRWDRLKDPCGLMHAFVEGVLPAHAGAHLLLAGPETDGVDDDPESAEVLAEVIERRSSLDPAARRCVHIAELPMLDDAENSVIVNALQHRADVVVQKSLAEGFGLTVAEAMWKRRPVVASRVGGIQDQIVDGESGVLLDDPTDASETANAVNGLLEAPALASSIGDAARQRVCDCFLPTHHFLQESAAIAAACR